MSDDGDDDPLQTIATGVALVLMGVLAVVLLALQIPWWWIAFPIGGGLVTLASGIASWYEAHDSESTESKQDALDELRARYARGELTETEFERRVERLVQTETVADARQAVAGEQSSEPGREHASETE